MFFFFYQPSYVGLQVLYPGSPLSDALEFGDL